MNLHPSPRCPGIRAARVIGTLLVAGMSLAGGAPGAEPVRPEEDAAARFWTAHVEPLLKDRCVECHNPTKPKSGLDLTSLQPILRGGERGSAVIPGRPDASHLLTFLRPDADPHMPPGTRKKLTDDEACLIRQWIEKLGAAGSNAGPGSPAPTETNGATAPPKPRFAWQPATGMSGPRAVDHFLELAWKLDRVKPAPVTGDSAFIRRVTLDLAGRIPTRAETRDFVHERGRDKRARLVDRLLAGEEYPRRMREVFDPVLMNRRGPAWEEKRSRQQWFAWLEEAFRWNRPWNEVLHELIVARPENPADRGAVWFLYERENNAQAIAESLAPVVFGVQVKCAQCHDHMVAREIKQAHYWGMVAAFNRSKNVDTPAGPGIAESAIGGFVSFANLRKESQPARLTFFNGRIVEETWPEDGEKEQDLPDLYVVPPPPAKEKPGRPAVPTFSRRAAFADAVTRDNPLLARAMVNRIWALLFGRGLVHPVDLMDSKHPPSHPELLDWLARDFERNGHDVKRLVRTLCTTRAYQLDAPPARPSAPKPGSPDAFAHALDKPLTAEQLFQSLLIATGNPADSDGLVAGKPAHDLRRTLIRQFPDLFPAEYNATLQQALFLSNADPFDHLLAPRDGTLPARLAALPDARSRIDEAFATVFGRTPDAAERKECEAYLVARPTEAGVKQFLWALLTGAEFQVNH